MSSGFHIDTAVVAASLLKSIQSDKLYVFAMGNVNDIAGSNFDVGIPFYNAAARNNVIGVVSCRMNTDSTKGLVSGEFNKAMFAEDYTVAAPGENIYSTNAFILDAASPIKESGTSMSTPLVTGTLGLIQEAYPYLNAKQLGDVLLSTTNQDIAYDGTYNDGQGRTFTDVPRSILYGQGLINADKATNGLGSLNAKRLSTTDVDTTYAQGQGGKQALYSVNTAGYNGVWSNNITETRVLLPGTGADQDAELKARQDFYTIYADYYKTAYWEDATPTTFIKDKDMAAYIAKYNAELAANPLLGLHVGLKKDGEGILRLTGNNTYQGATIVTAGALAVDGTIAGDAYSTSEGVLAGTGTIKGNVYNNSVLLPGTYTVNTVYDTDPSYKIGTLNIEGNLVSAGALEIVTDGTENSKLNVKGTADLTDATLYMIDVRPNVNMPLVNHKYTFLTSQGGITGAVLAEPFSPYVSLTTGVDGQDVYFVAQQTKPLGSLAGMTPSENSVGAAMNQSLLDHFAKEPLADYTQDLNNILYQDEATSRSFIKQTTAESRAQFLNQSPMSSLTNESIFSRLDTVDFSGNLAVNVQAASLDGQAPEVKMSLPVTLDANNNVWFKLFRGFENYNYNDSLENKSFGGAIGYDHALNLSTRIGALFSYGVTDYNTDNIEGKSHDWRVGIYGDHKSGDWDYQALATYGKNHYDLDRSVAWEGTKSNSDYKAKVWDGELKARYFIPSTQTKTWQVKPYGKLSYTHTAQDAYAETGTSTFKQSMSSASNNSWRGELGVELNRNFTNKTSWGGSVGYKRVLSGLNPELNGTFLGDTNGFTIQSDNDRNYVTYSLNARGSLGGKWMGQAEFRGEASSNTHKEILSITAKYSF